MNPEAVSQTLSRLTALAEAVEKDARAATNPAETTIDEVAKLFLQADRAHDELHEQMKRISAVKQWYREKIVPDRLKDAGLKNLKMADGTLISPSAGLRASIQTGQKEEAISWLRQNNLGDIVQETVNASTLSALAKKMLEEDNVELPEDLFKTYIYTSTSVRAGKGVKVGE